MRAPTQRRREFRRSDSISAYLQDIGAYGLLRRDEEVDLARRIRQGDLDAIEQLVCGNLRFVVSLARKYQHRGVALLDLINEGNLGLIRAAEKFDERKGVRFLSYAVCWIRQALVQAVAEGGHTVRVPIYRTGFLHRISKRANGLRQELGREPTRRELAAGCDVSEAEVTTTLSLGRSCLSLDARLDGTDDAKLLDYLADDGGAAPDDELLGTGLNDSVDVALGRLREREATVLRLYFGIAGGDPMTLEDIGARLGVTRERVRQLKEKALARLRTSVDARALASLRSH